MIAMFLALSAAALAAPAGGSTPSPPRDATPPFPPTHGDEGFIYMNPSRAAFDLAYESRARVLRDEMHALTKSDGGRLTAQHLAYLQEKLEALLNDYHRDLQRADPLR